MTQKTTYEELEERIKLLETEALKVRDSEEALRRSEAKYRLLFENAVEGIMIVRNDMIDFANPALFKILESREDTIRKTPYPLFIHPEDREMVVDHHRMRMKGESVETGYSFRIITESGLVKWLQIHSQRILWENSPASLCFIWDITERERAEEALQESERRYRLLAEKMTDIVWIMDMNLRTVYVSPSVQKMLGFSPEERLVQDIREQLTPSSLSLAQDVFIREITLEQQGQGDRERHIKLELEYYHKNGSTRWIENIVCGIRDNQGTLSGFHGVSRDITERRQAEEALRESEERYRELSIIDDLTQLYNSRYFFHQLKIEIDRADRYGQPLALLLLDIDDFKIFNDTYGHLEGDQVLWRLGRVVRRCLRKIDSAYRYGGEEFTILLPITTSGAGAGIAERIRTELKKENFSPVTGKDVCVTVSIGLAQYEPQEDMKAFVHRVDQLMYQGKKDGKDRVCSRQEHREP